MTVIGLDLGGTHVAGAVFDANGQVTAEDTVPLDGRGGGDVGSLVVACLNRLLAKSPDIDAVGISVPGVSHAKTGRVSAPRIAGWSDYPLRDEIRASLSYESVPVIVESDRSCGMMGEAWRGAARGCRNAVYLSVGPGIGAGILVDGRILRGAHDLAGAIGWMAVDRPWEEAYLACGQFEHLAAGDGVARRARALLAERPDYRGALRDIAPDALTARAVLARYDDPDEVAVATLTQAIAWWGVATANLVSLFNPERIVFGGELFGPAARFLDDVTREARRWAQPVGITQVTLVPSALGGAATLHGAGWFARGAVGASDR